MDPEQILLLSIAVCGASLLFLPKPRRWWVRPWLCRRNKGNLHLLKEELEEDRDSFKNFLRMDEETFEWLLTRVKPQIEKQDTKYRDSISARDLLLLFDI